MKTISVARLREVLNYDPETGIFTWKITTNSRAKQGQTAGSPEGKGYLRIGIDGSVYSAHRLAMAYVEGTFPLQHIDHRNGVRSDNRYANLRHATNADNGQNRGLNKNNTSGFTGVHLARDTGRWRATIHRGGKLVQLGCFDTPEEASAAYLTAKARFHSFQPTPR